MWAAATICSEGSYGVPVAQDLHYKNQMMDEQPNDKVEPTLKIMEQNAHRRALTAVE